MKETLSQKTQLDKKKLPFHDVLYGLAFPYFFTARQAAFTLHNKEDSTEGHKNNLTNEGLILDHCTGKIKLITHLCCPFSTYYFDLYCDIYCNSKY